VYQVGMVIWIDPPLVLSEEAGVRVILRTADVYPTIKEEVSTAAVEIVPVVKAEGKVTVAVYSAALEVAHPEYWATVIEEKTTVE
jgi:hypothetical protein